MTAAEARGGPPTLELSSFLNDLSLTATISPLPRPVASAPSPISRQFRVSISQATSTCDLFHCADVSKCTTSACVDKAVLAIVPSSDVATDYYPPTDPAFVGLLLADGGSGLPELDIASPDLRYVGNHGSTVNPPEDFSVDGSLVARCTFCHLCG